MNQIEENGQQFELVFREYCPPFWDYFWETEEYHKTFEEITGFCPDTITLFGDGELERYFSIRLFEYLNSKFESKVTAAYGQQLLHRFLYLLNRYEKDIDFFSENHDIFESKVRERFEAFVKLTSELNSYSNALYCASVACEEILRKKLEPYFDSPQELNRYLVSHICPIIPVRMRFLQEDTVRLAIKTRGILGANASKILEEASRFEQDFEQLLRAHPSLAGIFEELKEKYFWAVSFSVLASRTKASFVPDILNALNPTEPALNMSEVEVSPEIKEWIFFMQVCAYIKEEISSFAMSYFYYGMQAFWMHWAQKLGLLMEDFFQFTVPELIDALDHEKDLSLLARKRRLATVFRSGALPLRIIEGELALEQIKNLKKTQQSSQETISLTEINGLTAFSGKANGIVRLVPDRSAFSKFVQGEILVTAYTAPEFVPLMKKAAAIVTDAGGLTSHAAIVSRELRVPCVVGTKIATKVFKDGDWVEVDAEKGVVRKLTEKKKQ